MVVGESTLAGGLTDEEVDRLFHALADATRRDILHRCTRGEPSVSRLAEIYPMSFAAVQKHVAVLERAGLVSKQRRGREQRVRGEMAALREVHQLFEQFERLWRERLGRIDDILTDRPGTDPSEGASPCP
jgi:DNA-binding transcriptional ArsR family regulator